MFIIHKNGKNTSILPILISNSTSFMFHNIFSEMNIKKVVSSPILKKWGDLPHFLLEVELLVFTNIQAISTLVCLLLDDNGFLICNYSILYNTCLNNPGL